MKGDCCLMKIAILDDEVNYSLLSTPVKCFSVYNGEIQTMKPKYTNHTISHSTVCSKIIETYGLVNELFCISIINNNGIGILDDLIIALEYCLEMNLDIINLSNGITNFFVLSEGYNNLFDICMKLKLGGVKIVVAQSNRNEITIPSDFPNVYSVEYLSYTNKPVRESNFYVFRPIKIELKNHKILLDKSNSYACAFVTAFLSVAKKSKFINLFYRNIILFNQNAISNNLLFYSIEFLNTNDCIGKYIVAIKKNFFYEPYEDNKKIQMYYYISSNIIKIKCAQFWGCKTSNILAINSHPAINFSKPIIEILGYVDNQLALTKNLYNAFIKDEYIPQIIWPDLIEKLISRNMPVYERIEPDIYLILTSLTSASNQPDFSIFVNNNNSFIINGHQFNDFSLLYSYIINYFMLE